MRATNAVMARKRSQRACGNAHRPPGLQEAEATFARRLYDVLHLRAVPDVHGQRLVGQARPRGVWRDDRGRQPPLLANSHSGEGSGRRVGHGVHRGRAGAARTCASRFSRIRTCRRRFVPGARARKAQIRQSLPAISAMTNERLMDPNPRQPKRSLQSWRCCARARGAAGRRAALAGFLLVFAGAAQAAGRQSGRSGRATAQRGGNSTVSCAIAMRHDMPVTVRGAGTGNYGQAVPLQGGVVLDLSAHGPHRRDSDRTAWRCASPACAWAISKMKRARWAGNCAAIPRRSSRRRWADFSAVARAASARWRTAGCAIFRRCAPSKWSRWKPKPRVVLHEGEAVHEILHAWGTNGVITRIWLALTPAVDWSQCAVAFDTFDCRLRLQRENRDGDAVDQAAGDGFRVADSIVLHADTAICAGRAKL